MKSRKVVIILIKIIGLTVLIAGVLYLSWIRPPEIILGI